MTKPRVLMICQGHPRLVRGGTEFFAHDLHQALNEGGHAESFFVGCVTALHREARDVSALQSIDGAPNEFLLRAGSFDPFLFAHPHEIDAISALSRLLTMLKPDVVHFHHLLQVGAECLALVKRVLPNCRIVFTLHDFHPICARQGLMLKTAGDALCHQAGADACHECFPDIPASRFALRQFYLNNLFALVDRFIAPSRSLGDRFQAWGIDAARMSHIPNGVPASPNPAEGDASNPAGRFGYFGTIAPHKGVLLALEAAGRMDEASGASLSLFGDVAYQSEEFRTEFDRALRRTKGRAAHHGPYDRRDLARLMGGIDWVVVPSLWWENAPLVILEAFRHRRPVIAADIGGMAELVQHERNGLLFRRGDAFDLARAMTRAIGDPDLWGKLREGMGPVPTMAAAAATHAKLYGELVGFEKRMSA